MKTNILVIGLALILGASACTTTSSGKKVLAEEKIAQLAPALQTSVAGAVIYAYSKDKNSVKYLDLIKTTLNEFLVSGDLQPATLQLKIYALPIKELKTPEAQLIITPLLAAYKAYGEYYVQAGIEENAGLRLLVLAIINGLDAGLQGVAQIESN